MTRLPVRTIWAGNKTMACKKRRNSILISSAPRRPLGRSSPNHAFRFQAREVITIGPVAEQIVHRHAHGVDSVFELLDHVLLTATPVGQSDDLFLGIVAAVRNVEEVTDLIEEN